MEDLKNLMNSRLSFINYFKNKLSTHPPQKIIHSELIHELLIEKKKMHSNQSSQIKTSRTLIAQKIESPYKLMQFYEASKFIMKSYSTDFLSQSDSQEISKLVVKDKKIQNQKISDDLIHQNLDSNEIFKPEKHLNSNIQNKKKLILKIIRLYYEFFMAQKSESKAQEIMHMYKKKLCEQNQIATTLFCWLNDWVLKQFTNFIKNQMNDLNQTKNTSKIRRKKSKIAVFNNEQANQVKNPLRQTIFQFENSLEPNDKKFKRISKSSNANLYFSIDLSSAKQIISEQTTNNLLMKQLNLANSNENDLSFLKPRNNLSVVSPQVFLTIEKSKQSSPKIKYKDTSKGRRYYSSQTSNLIAQKIEKNDNLTQKQTLLNQGDNFPINRQIFIGAYYEKFSSLYKNLQTIIPDLDIQYIKQIKRNDRKTELRKRLKQISRMFIRTQPLIKTSIDDYYLYFKQKNHRLNKLFSKKDKNPQKKEKKSIEGYQNDTQKNIRNLEQKRFRFSVNLDREIPSNLFNKNPTQMMETNTLVLSYPKKKQQKLKQTLSLNRPLQFQFNLPRIPDNQKGKPKENSKIVLIQSGRYKILDSPRLSETLELSTKKNHHQELSINMTGIKQKNQSLVIQSQANSNKTQHQPDKRSASILSMITKKKKKTSRRYKKALLNQVTQNFSEKKSENTKIQNIKKFNLNQRQGQEYKVPKEIVEVISNLESSDFYTLSGWEKGQETPVIS